jgi:predicted P-loop ATPase
MSELDALTRASSSAIKSFVTRRRDRFRPPYGKHVIEHPRQCVFTGSINPDGRGYLRDPTGARRFWPVTCGEIDVAAIERDRDQLWAESVMRYRKGQPWWLETPELEGLARAEQEMRFEHDEWEPIIRTWLGSEKDVSVGEVLAGPLGLKTALPES